MLSRLAFSLSVVGLVCLFVFSLLLEPLEVSFYELDESFLGERVRLKGRLLWFKTVKGTAIFELGDELGLKRFKGVLFSPSEEQWRVLKQKGLIEVEGRIERYKGELELVAEKLSPVGLDAG